MPDHVHMLVTYSPKAKWFKLYGIFEG